MMYLLLIVGFVLLIKGADFFVDGASSVAGILKVPSVIVGLTIVSIGTSCPEAAVSISAGLSGNADISLGNVIGSNLFNLLMVIGICAIVKPVPSPKDILKRDMFWNIAVSVLMLVFMIGLTVARYEGIILLAGIVTYIAVLVRSALKNNVEDEGLKIIPIWLSIIYIIGGAAAIIFGGDLVVDNASKIAEAFGMSKTLVGLTIVAIGTSLPELVTSIVAARKGNSGIAIGNAVGSSIFNILFILGIASSLSPIKVDKDLLVDAAILIGVSVITYIFAKTGEKTSRFEGGIMVACYCAYTAFIIARNYM
ncbi:MAG: calcium/sodium antiporter [Ruminococcus sp.]|nr:calcium/sodium antiporter [Ruminococcus sp.]